MALRSGRRARPFASCYGMDASRFPATIGGQAMEADVAFDMVAIDLGKLSFHLHGVSSDGVVLSRKVSRAKLFAVVTEFAPTIIAMEACPSAHYWGRRFQETGRHVRLIHPRFVKPFVRGAKNDAIDAEAIFEAASRPTMRFVPVKTIAQQDLQAVHRIRDRLVCQRTSLINQVRGLLAEYGIILAKGPSRLTAEGPAAVADAGLSDLARELFAGLFDQLRDLERRIRALDVRLVAFCRENAGGRRVVPAPPARPSFNPVQ